MGNVVIDRYQEVVGELIRRRKEHCLPVGIRTHASKLGADILAVLFPHFSETLACDSEEIGTEIERIEQELDAFVNHIAASYRPPPAGNAQRFLESLVDIHQQLGLDARAIFHGDPAAQSIDEVILTYPGFYAVAIHRIAHRLHQLGYPLLPRLLSEHAHQLTGVDIHPGATIGHSFFIDHGTGIVIGETAIIGNGVKLYQGVTLGALVVEKSLANRKRHPTLQDHVVVYANATILGGDTVVGHDSVIGGNAWITAAVPPFSIVGRHSDVHPRKPVTDDAIEFNI